MRPSPIKTFLGMVLAAIATAFASPTTAGKLDLTLSNFLECPGEPGDPTYGAGCTINHADFETFLAEYAFGIAPKVLSPAETLGYSGFYMGINGSLTILPLGSAREDRWQRGTASNEIQRVMYNPGVHIRKGFPHFFGQPWSIEIGSMVNYLVLSELVSLGGEVKVSFFEGYHSGWRGALPDIAARGSVIRVVGQSDIDMTIVSVDGSVSYSFGLAGVVNLTPYAGYQLTLNIMHMEPMLFYDGSQFHSQETRRGPDTYDLNNNGNTTEIRSVDYFPTTDLGNPFHIRHHAFFGLRLIYELLEYTIEAEWALPREWETDKGEDNEGNPLTASVGSQIRISGGLGVNF